MSEKQWVLFRRYISNQSRQSAADAVRGHRLLRSVRLRGLTRPKKSLHLLLINPDSNLHIFFNPKYCLLLLNPSLWSGA